MHCRPFNTPQNLMEGYPRSLLGWLAKGLFLLFLLQLVISRPCKSFLFLDFLCVKKTWHFLLICENKNDRFDWDGRTNGVGGFSSVQGTKTYQSSVWTSQKWNHILIKPLKNRAFILSMRTICYSDDNLDKLSILLPKGLLAIYN